MMSQISKSIIFEEEEEERLINALSDLLPQLSVIKPKYHSDIIHQEQVISLEVLFYKGNKVFLNWEEDYNNKKTLKEISRQLKIKLQEELGKEMKKFVVTSLQGNIKKEKKKLILVETLSEYDMETPFYNLIDGKQCQMIVVFEISDKEYKSGSQIIDSKGNSNLLSEIINQEKQ